MCASSRPPPSFGHSKEALLKLMGSNMSMDTDSSSCKTSEKSFEISTTREASLERKKEEEGHEPKVQEDNPMMDVDKVLPDDENILGAIFEYPGTDYLDDNEEGCIIEDEPMVDGFGDKFDGLAQEDFDKIFFDVPHSEEFILPDLSNPKRLARLLAPVDADTFSHSMERQFKRFGVDAFSNFESGKRKLGPRDKDTASSNLKGETSKKAKYAK